MEHDPGPRGSPQLPQGPGEGREEALLLGPKAKAESCCSSLAPLHDGHSARFEPITRASKEWPHSLQMYSKMGTSDRLPLVFS